MLGPSSGNTLTPPAASAVTNSLRQATSCLYAAAPPGQFESAQGFIEVEALASRIQAPILTGSGVDYAAAIVLRGHLKTGQRWSLQNRPTESGLGLSCFTPPPPVE